MGNVSLTILQDYLASIECCPVNRQIIAIFLTETLCGPAWVRLTNRPRLLTPHLSPDKRGFGPTRHQQSHCTLVTNNSTLMHTLTKVLKIKEKTMMRKDQEKRERVSDSKVKNKRVP